MAASCQWLATRGKRDHIYFVTDLKFSAVLQRFRGLLRAGLANGKPFFPKRLRREKSEHGDRFRNSRAKCSSVRFQP
jgi:hypothetical protein